MLTISPAHRLAVPLTLAFVAAACAPNPNDPPTRITDPSTLPTKAAPKTESKAADERKARAEKRRADQEKAAADRAQAAKANSLVLGESVPDFALKDLDGKPIKLADYAGKTVILEWFNPECPFVKYAHGAEGPLRGQAARVVSDDTVWLAINSGGVGKQGNGIPKNKRAATEFELAHPVLIDEPGVVGRAYGAKTTPHMYVISTDGKLAYQGAIDNAPMGRIKADVGVTNYVDAALADLAAGRPVAVPETQSYGCSVKYAS